jgi:hypothetical protein
MILQKPSNEQKTIIENINNNNIVVNAVAGSGKTTTVLHIAKNYYEKQILLLTYNTKLRKETEEKIHILNIENLECHTYHSYFHKYYDTCNEDRLMNKIVDNNIKSKNKNKYDIFIMDECQDMTITYYKGILKIIKDNIKHNAKICILGDENQNIFQFNKADNRFIKFADQIFNINNYSFIKCDLSTSYRITKPMAEFMNNCILNEHRLYAIKESKYKPNLINCNSYDYNTIKNILLKYNNEGYNWNEIFILGPSCNGYGPFIKFTKKFKKEFKNNILIYVSRDDENLGSDEKQLIIGDKLVFTTFHQVKGLERKVVIVFNFDDSYFKFYAKNEDNDICPNTIYVALTRASERLTLVKDQKMNMMPFININKLYQYIEYDEKEEENKSEKLNNINQIKTQSIIKLLKYLPFEIEDELIKLLNCKQIRKPIQKILIHGTTAQKHNSKKYYESVSDINGTVIPAYYQYIKTNYMSIFANVKEKKEWLKNEQLNNYIKDSNGNILLYKLLKLGVLNEEIFNEYNYRSYQITYYNWLSYNDINKCIKRLDSLCLSDKGHYEKKILDINQHNGKVLMGCIDYDDNNMVYEFKCVEKLTTTHFLQLALYAYLNEQNNNKNVIYNLYNILTDELWEITYDINNLYKLVDIIKQYKNINKLISDDDFLHNINIVKDKFFTPMD